MFFEWDESKNQRNIAKHGISLKVRIISARKASLLEEQRYERGY